MLSGSVKMKGVTNYVILLFSIFTILPFLLLCLYIHPHYDDYFFVNELSGRGILESTVFWYKNWSGRYSTSFINNILALGTGNIYVYRFYPIVLIVLWVSAFFIFFKNLLSRTLPGLKNILIISIFFFVIYLYKLPEITSGLYYATLAYTGSIGTIAFILLLSVLLSILKEMKAKKKTIYTIAGCVLSIIIGGAYEPVMVISIIILLLISFVLWYKRDRNLTYFIPIILTMVLAGIVLILAPGNKVRGGADLLQMQKVHFFSSIIQSISMGVSFAINSVQNQLLLLLTILFIPIAQKLYEKEPIIEKYLDIHPIFSFSLIFVISIAAFFPSIWALGNTPSRITDQVYIFIIITWFLFLQTLVNYFIKKGITFHIPPTIIWIAKIGIIICLIPSLTNKNVGRAYSDLLSKAPRYNQQLFKRYELIKHLKSEGKKDIILPPLFDDCSCYPLTIYYNYQELGENSKSGPNKIYAKYWNVDSIRLENTTCIDFITKTRVN